MNFKELNEMVDELTDNKELLEKKLEGWNQKDIDHLAFMINSRGWITYFIMDMDCKYPILKGRKL